MKHEGLYYTVSESDAYAFLPNGIEPDFNEQVCNFHKYNLV